MQMKKIYSIIRHIKCNIRLPIHLHFALNIIMTRLIFIMSNPKWKLKAVSSTKNKVFLLQYNFSTTSREKF